MSVSTDASAIASGLTSYTVALWDHERDFLTAGECRIKELMWRHFSVLTPQELQSVSGGVLCLRIDICHPGARPPVQSLRYGAWQPPSAAVPPPSLLQVMTVTDRTFVSFIQKLITDKKWADGESPSPPWGYGTAWHSAPALRLHPARACRPVP